jgi:3-deoxy-D-manno-octulosonic-acid transferase
MVRIESEAGNANNEPLSLKMYVGLTWALTPLAHALKPLLAFYGGFKDTVPERLGRFPDVLDQLRENRGNRSLIWIHAVSVGEAAVAGPIMDQIRSRRPDALIALSTTTFTGREFTQRNLKPDALFFFPLDLPSVMNRLVDKLQPDCFIDIEVELWPNCFRALKRRGALMVLANGRISDRAAKPPGVMRGMYRWLFGCFDALFMRSTLDVERAIVLGSPPDRTYLAGNLKYASVAAGSLPMEERIKIRSQILGAGGNGKLLVAGSTHPGEDEQILVAWKKINDGLLPEGIGPLKLVLAPRHLEQVERVMNLARSSGAECMKWTDAQNRDEKADVIVVDTIGELMKLYAASDVAFVGGSLVPRGGHNVLEPVAMGVPTVHGPSVTNFHDLVLALGEADLLIEVKSADELAEAVAKILTETNQDEYRERARALIDRQMKAADMIGEWITSNLPRSA